MLRLIEILKVANEKRKKDNDTVILIVGAEGKGKSVLMFWIIYNWCLINDIDYLDIERVALDQQDFVKALQISKKGQYVVFDEAGDGLYSREGMSGINKGIVKVFMVCRGKNLLSILCLPSFFDIDVYFRKHRVKGLINVYKRGRFEFYTKKRINKIIDKCEYSKRIWGVNPSFRDTYPDIEIDNTPITNDRKITIGQLYKQYKEKKQKKINEAIEKLFNEYGDNNAIKSCVYCASKEIRHRSKYNDYLCRKCGKTFAVGGSPTTNTDSDKKVIVEGAI